MNDVVSLFILAVIQGITEWFPVSSSSQIALAAHLLHYNLSLADSVALHFGTLFAVFVYFGKDIMCILRELLQGKWHTPDGKLGLMLIFATIPAGLVGFLLRDFVASLEASFGLMALGLAITSLLLLIGSVAPRRNKPLSYLVAFAVGLAQIASLFRGISRSGSTIVTGLLLGLDEKTAVKFSFLLSIPIVFGANLVTLGTHATLPPSLFWAALVSFVVSISMIHVSFTYVLSNRKNLRWFALYTGLVALVLGISLWYF